jgi:uncharacterized membrane protein
MNLSWNAGGISHLLTLVLFAFIGFKVSGKLRPPKNFWGWTLLVAATILSFTIGTNIELIGVDFFGIYLNSLLAGTGLGLIIGFVVRSRKDGVTAAAAGAK